MTRHVSRSPLRRALLSVGLAVAAIGLASCAGSTGPSPTAVPTPSGPTTAGSASASVPASPSGAPAVPSVLPADSCRLAVDAMTPAQQAGQLVMVGYDLRNDNTPAAGELLRSQRLGGVLLMNTTDGGVTQVRSVTDALRRAAGTDTPGLLIAADQEGGQVKRLSGPGFATMPSAAEQGRMSTATLAASARQWGADLHRAGVDVDLAPVADVVPPDLASVNQPIARYGRGFGHDPATVSSHVAAFVTGMRDGGTATAVKHFPGLGQVVGNTDVTNDVTDTRTTRHDPLLAPFAAGIGAGTDMVMVSSARYTRIDPTHPALWSSVVIEDMLRGDLGWQGVVISDDLGVAAQVASVPAGERAVRFVDAGGDIAVTVDPKLADDMAGALADRAGADPAFAAKVRAATVRVLDLKAHRHLASCRPA